MDETNNIERVIEGINLDIGDIISDIKSSKKVKDKIVETTDWELVITRFKNIINTRDLIKKLDNLETLAANAIVTKEFPITYKSNLTKEECDSLATKLIESGAIIEKKENKIIDPANDTRKTGLELYTEWVTPKIDYIKSELEGYYPGLWDLQVNESVAARVKSVISHKVDNLSVAQSILSSFTYETLYTIYIKFPQVTIKNSKRQTRDIRDLFIRISLNPRLGNAIRNHHGNYFTGWRATKYMSDYSNNYSHSHLPGHQVNYSNSNTNDPFAPFCLGSTEVNNISAVLSNEFNEDTFSIILQQIKSYVGWESLEGGPHRRIADINDGKRSPDNLGNSISEKIYKEFLTKVDINIPYTTNKKSFIDLVSINKEGVFNKLIKDCISDTRYLVYHNPTTKEKFTLQDARNNDTVDSINRQYSSRVWFKFREEDIKFKCIPDINNNSENLEQVPNPYIVDYIASKLEKLINKSLIDDIRN